MPDLNALVAAYYTTNAQAQEYARQIIAECLARGINLEKLQEANKPKAEPSEAPHG